MSKESTTGTHSESLRSILGGASVFISGQMFVKLAGFAINTLLIRALDPGLYGVYAYAKPFVDAFASITTFGSDIAVLRFLPAFETDPSRQNRVLGVASIASLLGSLLIAGGLFVLAPAITRSASRCSWIRFGCSRSCSRSIRFRNSSAVRSGGSNSPPTKCS